MKTKNTIHVTTELMQNRKTKVGYVGQGFDKRQTVDVGETRENSVFRCTRSHSDPGFRPVAKKIHCGSNTTV